ncbi:hypothetical protein CLV55_1172 [Flavobacterium aciduliphilum]|uniref:Uncharacterized protein n=1 Tax=Flavobacterium aciduliphilum TaxID=1101402 RepID=A0A328Y8S4_9FLAO|nr:hypothetical protein CLV55_1172 [Flavobacterium aciduliphilum]
MVNAVVLIILSYFLSFFFKERSSFLLKTASFFIFILIFFKKILVQLPWIQYVNKKIKMFFYFIISSPFLEGYLKPIFQVFSLKACDSSTRRDYNFPTSPLGAPLYIHGNCVNNYKTNFFNPIY